MPNILELGRDEILGLKPQDVMQPLLAEEVVHIAQVLGAFWQYDYDAAAEGKVGLHAELKSKRHSNAFFVSKILLAGENMQRIMSLQIALRLLPVLGKRRPDYVVGIPDGATSLGKYVAMQLNAREAEMEKRDGKISLTTNIGSKNILLVEDFCTKGTGFIEAVTQIHESQPEANVMLYNPVILNRGGMKLITVSEVSIAKVVSVVEKRIEDWDPDECPLCRDFDSKPIKPKATDENWIAITNSQK